jgi:hypothetical protein
MGRAAAARTVERMSTTGPSEQYDTTEQYASEPRWEQPGFGPSGPTVSGPVLPAAGWTGQARTVAAPSAEEARLRTVVALVWPVALVLAVLTGHWLPLLAGAVIVGGLLRRRLLQLRYQRITVANTLR